MNIEVRVAALEARLRAVEDELEILRLITSYGPLADSGSASAAAELWVTDGAYDFGDATGSRRTDAPDGVTALLESDYQQTLITTGSSHLTGPPLISVNGDTAQAVGYSFVVLKDGEHWRVDRAAINHWTLVRLPDGWRIEERVNRVIDGSPASHEVMRRALELRPNLGPPESV